MLKDSGRTIGQEAELHEGCFNIQVHRSWNLRRKTQHNQMKAIVGEITGITQNRPFWQG